MALDVEGVVDGGMTFKSASRAGLSERDLSAKLMPKKIKA
jgi:hypothetical protein